MGGGEALVNDSTFEVSDVQKPSVSVLSRSGWLHTHIASTTMPKMSATETPTSNHDIDASESRRDDDDEDDTDFVETRPRAIIVQLMRKRCWSVVLQVHGRFF